MCTDAASRNHVEDVRERAGIARELKLTMTKSPAQRQAERSAARAAMEDETNRRRAWCVDGSLHAAVVLTSVSRNAILRMPTQRTPHPILTYVARTPFTMGLSMEHTLSPVDVRFKT